VNTKDRLELMGEVVTVTQEFKRESDGPWYKPGTRRFWEAKDVDPRAGWVTGFRTLQNGTLQTNGFEGPTYLTSIETVSCVLVAYWPTYEPVNVPLDGFKVGGEPYHNSEEYWNTPEGERGREWLRLDAEHWPRDEKGRWK